MNRPKYHIVGIILELVASPFLPQFLNTILKMNTFCMQNTMLSNDRPVQFIAN